MRSFEKTAQRTEVGRTRITVLREATFDATHCIVDSCADLAEYLCDALVVGVMAAPHCFGQRDTE
jgi:hypothetical protein